VIYIETLNGTRYDLQAIGLKPIRFNIDSLSPLTTAEYVAGRDGYLDLGTTFDGRTMRGSFLLQSDDLYDYSLLLNEAFKLFDSRKHFYLIHKYQPKRRWKVKTATFITPERVNPETSILEVEFVSSSPYAESYGTTLDPFTFDGELWQVGQGVISEDLVYAHNTTSFSIYNGSDIDIDPRELPLKIKYQGASNNLTIKNTSTGDEWKFTGSSGTNDTILLDGVRSLKNSLTIFGQTNRKLITLKQGWNDFTLTGTSGSFLISFDFRFYNI
jgi:hypothetical protein